MFIAIYKKRTTLTFRCMAGFVLLAFVFALPGPSYAQLSYQLPSPGAMVGLTPQFAPPLIKALMIHPENPLQFDFLIDPGNGDFKGMAEQDKANEYRKLIKYFLAALTVPEKDLWVNLSPYEKDRIIADNFGKTEMGRDLLSQDYILKQITASLMYPEQELGKEFWQKVYKQAQERFGTTEIPVNTFNKVWIVADKASVYEHGNTVFLVDSHLKVMLEQDYVAMQHNLAETPAPSFPEGKQQGLEREDASGVSSQVIREVILPAIEKEVNEGKNFALLRQINNSLILAIWYKTTLKESLLGKVYADRNKTDGVDQDIANNQKIYEQYLEAFKKGVYNYIKEDQDPVTQEVIPRKYFSGGFSTEYRPLDDPKTPDKNEGFLAARIKKLDSRDATVIVQAIKKTSSNSELVTANLEEPGTEEKSFSSPVRSQEDLDRQIGAAIDAINRGEEPADARKYIKVAPTGILLASASHKEKRYRPGSSLVTYVVDESGNLKDETWRPDGVTPVVTEQTVILSNGSVKYPGGHALAGQEVKGRYNDDGTFVIDQENGTDVLQNEYLTDVDFVTNPANYVIPIPADAEGDFVVTTKSGTRINIKGGDYVVINTRKGKADGMQGVQAIQFNATYVDYAEYMGKLKGAAASPITWEEAEAMIKEQLSERYHRLITSKNIQQAMDYRRFTVEFIPKKLSTMEWASWKDIDQGYLKITPLDSSAASPIVDIARRVKEKINKGLPQYDFDVEDAGGDKVQVKITVPADFGGAAAVFEGVINPQDAEFVKFFERLQYDSSFIDGEGRDTSEYGMAKVTIKKSLRKFGAEFLKSSSSVGGIDLNPANLNLQIKRDGKGVALPMEFQDIPNINVNGFIPVIINITPVTNLPLLLGINASSQGQQLSSIQ